MSGNFHEYRPSPRPFFFNCKPRANFPRGRLYPFHLDASLLVDATGRLRKPFKLAERAHNTFRLSGSPGLYFNTPPRKVVCLNHASRKETDKPHAQRLLSKKMFFFQPYHRPYHSYHTSRSYRRKRSRLQTQTVHFEQTSRTTHTGPDAPSNHTKQRSVTSLNPITR